jgi:hypothetical protein
VTGKVTAIQNRSKSESRPAASSQRLSETGKAAVSWFWGMKLKTGGIVGGPARGAKARNKAGKA